MKYLYLDLENDVIRAVSPRSVSSERLVEGCQEVLVPLSFSHQIHYTNDEGQPRARDMSASAFLASMTHAEKRFGEYPPVTDYIDGVVKGDQAQIDAYIAACQAVKAKYPKPE